ncbi:Inner membrane protein YbaN [Rhodocyclaceae bacterium]|nr:Inner membrane protein YbaN [Rhodocyclaceae bacterium]
MGIDTMTEPQASIDYGEEADPHPSAWVRTILWIAGSLALLLGIIGIVLPGLPTTPFVIAAAACYARASPRFYHWLLANKTFGPLIIEWRRHHSIPYKIKIVAIITMTLTISASIWMFSGKPWLQGMLAAIAVTTAIWLYRVPSRDRPR